MFNTIASKDTPKSFKDFYFGQWVHPIKTAKKYPVAFTVCQLIGVVGGWMAGKAIANAIINDIVIKTHVVNDQIAQLPTEYPLAPQFGSPIETVYTPAVTGRIIPDIDDVAVEVCR